MTASALEATVRAATGSQLGRSVPGISAVHASAGGGLEAAAVGIADLSSGRVMTPETICNWFSMTKVVTATAVVQLADRGLLDLDAPVIDAYEPFSMLRPDERARTVSARHLLSHSAGVANPLPLRWVHLATEPGPDRSRFVERLLQRNRRLRFEPGSRAAYSNLGFLVLGELITRIAGEPFERYVATNILEPLGMSRTGFTAVDEDLWAVPYQQRSTALGVLTPLLIPRAILGPTVGRFRAFRHFYVDGAAYGGLVGPATDAARFLRAHLGDGEVDGVRIVSAPAARSMRRIATRGRRLEVGLGWFRRGRTPATDFIEHLGGGAGYWSCMRMYPERGTGVVVMGNSTSYDHNTIVAAITSA